MWDPRTSRRRPGAGILALLVGSLLWTSCADLREELPTTPTEAEAPARARGPAGAQLQDLGPAIEAANRHTRRLMGMPGVVGTGVGLNDAGRPAVKIFVVHPGVENLPTRLDDAPTQVEVTGMFVIHQDRTERARPAPVGFSVGHPAVTAGTLGARVTDGTNVYILSNNHVTANSNDASIGDPTLQPGSFDGGSDPDDVIGTLFDFEEILFDGSGNLMDAAISLVDPADVSGSTPDGAGYGAPGTNPTAASLGMDVQKYGRTTGHTFGEVAEVNVTVSVCYETRGPFRCAKSATFTSQFAVTPGDFSAGGDSGSLIVTAGSGNNPVGLLFAGSSTRTIANPIGPVLDRFGVEIDPTVPEAGDPEESGTLSGTVTDAETGEALAGATVSVDGTGLSATTGSNGGYTIGDVPAGTHDVTASADGYISLTRTAEVVDGGTTTLDFALAADDSGDPGDPGDPADGMVSVTSVSYTTSGGRNQDRHLNVRITLEDDAGSPVPDASVSATLQLEGGGSWDFSGTTGGSGTVAFGLNNAPSGCYETTVTGVDAGGLEWDGETPSNELCK